MWKRTLATPSKIVFLLVAVGMLIVSSPPAQTEPCQGFGATTPGGASGTTVAVTNLNDSGPGSLREALSAGNRTVVFEVGGEIVLTSAISVNGAFITIDGLSAPSLITLRGVGLSLHDPNGMNGTSSTTSLGLIGWTRSKKKSCVCPPESQRCSKNVPGGPANREGLNGCGRHSP